MITRLRGGWGAGLRFADKSCSQKSPRKFLQTAALRPQAVSTASKHTGSARVGGCAAGPAARRLPPKTLPHRAQQFSACFYGKVFAFCGLCFFADFALFAAGTERIARPPQGRATGQILSTLPLADFGPLRWGRIVPIPARARQTDGFFIPYRPVLPTAG